ncbi:MAG: glycosyltransferase, partial [Gemmatimonadota bacterium]
RIEVIPNGVDVEALSPEPDGARYDEPTVLYLGRLKRYKRVDLVLRAVALLKQRGVAARFLVGGKGAHAKALQELARSLDIGDRVEFLGFVPHETKLELFRRSWVHVLTSPKEGWGIANMEAAACATPTVASDAPGLRESVVDGTTGFLVPHGDVDALADALELLLGDDALRERLGHGARALAEGYTWKRGADAMESLLTRVVTQSRVGYL